MLRTFGIAVTAAVLLSPAANAQSYTTRIEPRPFYGAVVTLEEGVRVIRPLPPERHVIINPDNATPLVLGFNETRVYDNRVVRNYNFSDNRGSSGGRNFAGSNRVYGPNLGVGHMAHYRWGQRVNGAPSH
jgi:hypothetical protein